MRIRSFKLPCRLFTEKCAWNQRADDVPVIEASENHVKATFGTFKRPSTMWVNHSSFAFPIFLMHRPGQHYAWQRSSRNYFKLGHYPPSPTLGYVNTCS